MGTGKTTLGKYLAKMNQLSYIDLDEHIATQEKSSIPDIFKAIGESGFRQLEFEYLKKCIQNYDIISTGGGIIEGDQSFEILKKQPKVIWLDCDISIVYNRISHDSNRPNANNKSLFELKSLYSSRFSRYNEIAFIKINSNQSLSVLQSEIMEEIVCE
ncbi:shikimate kinase [Staphylococcus edaphicus]|nr:shikimate kinase [Staphylococcus edaphicus]UQW82772.1 shikimate kinase [Staphylococcus edaphicus]